MSGAARGCTWKWWRNPLPENGGGPGSGAATDSAGRRGAPAEAERRRQSYAFIGLGNLGRRLARNLSRARFPVTGHDRDPDAMPPPDPGDPGPVARATSARRAAAGADAVITCLPSPAATRAALLGEDGALAGLRRGGCWIEMGTNDPEEIHRLAAIAAEHGIDTLEAPVTGGVHRASTADITILVGGPDSVLQTHLPALRAMGDPVIPVGELGQASVMKVITNMLAFLHLLGAGEALMLARKAGIDLGTAFTAIRESSGTSFVHETESQVILNGSYDIGFTLDLACKDSGLAVALGQRSGVPLPLGELVAGRLAEARERFGGDAWSPMAVRLLEEAVGVDLRAPGFPASLDPEAVEPD